MGDGHARGLGLTDGGGETTSGLIMSEGLSLLADDEVIGAFFVVFSLSCFAFWRCLARRFLNQT